MTSVKIYPSLLQSVLLVLAAIGAQIVLGIAVVVPLFLLGIDLDTVAMPVTAAVNLATFAAVVAWALWRRGQSPRHAFPLGRMRVAYLLPLAMMIAGLGILCSEIDNLTRFVFPMPEILAEIFADFTEVGFAAFITLVFVAPLTEETVFRGIILRGLRSRYSAAGAVLLSSVLFSLMHVNPYQFAPALVGGVALGWLYLKSGSVWLCMLGHGLFNLQPLVIPFLPFAIPGYNAAGIDSPVVEFQPLWFDLLGLAAAAFGFLGLRYLLGPGEPAPALVVIDAELVEPVEQPRLDEVLP